MNEATWPVRYIPRGKTEVLETTVRIDFEAPWFTATNLAVWGCGKRAPHAKGAIMMLVQDMATIVEMTPNFSTSDHQR